MSLSSCIKLTYAPNYEKKCERLELVVKMKDKTIAGKNAYISRQDNEIIRLRKQVARLMDEIKGK